MRWVGWLMTMLLYTACIWIYGLLFWRHCAFGHTNAWTCNTSDVYLLTMQTQRGVNCELEIATTYWNCHRTFSCQKTTARIFTPSHNKTRLPPIGYLQYLLSNHRIFNLFISISVHISYFSAAKMYRNVTFLLGYGHGWSTSLSIWPQII
jgi:hypothetical protein